MNSQASLFHSDMPLIYLTARNSQDCSQQNALLKFLKPSKFSTSLTIKSMSDFCFIFCSLCSICNLNMTGIFPSPFTFFPRMKNLIRNPSNGSVVTQNTVVESGTIYAGIPAKKVKDLNKSDFAGEIERISNNYVMYSNWFKEE